MKKVRALLLILAIYIFAIAVGYLSINYLPIDSFVLKVFLMDVVATIIIWIFTLIFKNTSIYDPYWSVIPMAISFYAFFHYGNYTFINTLYLFVLNIWSLRLTINWCIVFTGFDYEDWRYRHYRESLSKPLFHLVNFTGLQMIPTLIVFASLTPMFSLFNCSSNNYFSLIGIAIIIFGILMELFADHQMHTFLKETKEKVTCRKGLWKYSRHPNYLGEISIWVGTFITMIFAAPQYWYLGFGMILMICLFLFISIPLAEKRQLQRRKDFADYRKTTSMLLLVPPRKMKNEEK